MKSTYFKSITLITAPGKGLPLVEELYKKNLPMVDLNHARGSYIGAPIKSNGMAVESEQEIVTCVVDAEQADAVFAQIYELAGVDQPKGGFMYMQELKKSTKLVLPEEQNKTP